MSTTVSDSTIKGKVNVVAGKVKQTVGEAVGNEKLANKGAAQQIKGHAQEAWGTVKESVKDAMASQAVKSEGSMHDVREKMTSTAQNAKDNVQHGVDPEHHPKP